MQPGYRVMLLIMVAAVLAAYPVLPAGAHAYLASAEPAAEAALDSPPEVVRLTFSEQPDVAGQASWIMVFGPDGARADLDDLRREDRTLVVTVIDRGAGSYCVEWQVVSAVDGHPTQGAHRFHVGEAGEPACPVPEELRDESLPDTGTGDANDQVDEGLPFYAGDAARIITALAASLAVLVAVWVFRRRRGGGAGPR